MKKSFGLTFILAAFLSLVFTGCPKKTDGTAGKKLSVVASIFPEYDWAKEVIGSSESAELHLLVNNGTDLHSFQPSAADILKIKTADIFIYTGGESDGWVTKALSGRLNPDMIVINVMDVLKENVVEEEIVEGMQDSQNESHDSDKSRQTEQQPEYDEHLWLSPANALIVTSKIAEALEVLDFENAGIYAENLVLYNSRLEGLQKEMLETSLELMASGRTTLVFCDRYPFRYFIDDLNLNYYAAFSGCFAETEASFETLNFLIEKVKQLSVPAVFVTESSDKKLARTVISGSGLKCSIITMDSMQAVTLKQAESGTTYISVMQENLNKLKNYGTMALEK